MKSLESKTSENTSKAMANQSFGKDCISLESPHSTITIQPKLSINQPDDIYEQEADRVANEVMTMQSPSIQTKQLQISSVQRMCAHCEEEQKSIQRKEFNGGEVTSNNEFENYVGNLSGGGQSLPEDVRSFYEPRFGYDFSNVKVHTDSVATKSAQSINALAYTSGNNIVFNEGQYSPGTDSGKRLLGHELTHVVQQNHPFDTSLVGSNPDNSQNKIPADIQLYLSPDTSIVGPDPDDDQTIAGLIIQRADDEPIGQSLPIDQDQTVGPEQCCCCVTGLSISNIGQIDDATHMGHQFNLNIGLTMNNRNISAPPGLSKSCILEWWETTNVPAIPGHTPNTPTDMYNLYPQSPTFDPWKNRQERCSTSEMVTITDPPALAKRPGRTVNRTLDFRLKVNSNPGCDCENSSMEVTARQVLSMVSGAADWSASSFTTP